MRTGHAVVLAGLSALFLLTGDTRAQQPDYTGNCTDAGCHNGYTSKAVVHGPVATASCDACHEVMDQAKHKFAFAEAGADLCLQCHDEPEGKVVHQPVGDGACTTCHDPHAGDIKGLLRGASEAALCARCHDKITKDLTYLHGPVAAGVCTVCHAPHASDHAALLPGPDREVCVQCHTTLGARIEEKATKHPPATESCIICHDPHGADNRLNLKEMAPALCLDCHDAIADIMDDATVTHDALTTGRACMNCHDPHASDVERLLQAEPMDLCLTCHDKPVESDNGKLLNIKGLLATNPNHHGPIRQKNCADCHNVHGGEHFRMLIEAYPAVFYAPFDEENYALCFSCHEPDMVRHRETTKLTNFRNGKRNLHYLHVNRSVKGRTCRACHNTHASLKPKHITETVRFGTWELPVNYKKTETGGSCQPGCHKNYRYDRRSAVVNLPEQAGP